MIVILIIVSVILLFCALYVILMHNKKKNRIPKISFKESMDLAELPIITFYSNRTKLNFLLDTGSNLSHINKHILNVLNYKIKDKEVSVIGITGDTVTTQVCSIIIEYRNQKFEEEFIIGDLDRTFKSIKSQTGVQIHGILGNKFFEKYKYILDFKEFVAYSKK